MKRLAFVSIMLCACSARAQYIQPETITGRDVAGNEVTITVAAPAVPDPTPVPVPQLGTSRTGYINVMDPPYNAKGDTQKVDDATCSGSNLTSMTANFKAAAVGKRYLAIEQSQGLDAAAGNIVAVVSPTTITLDEPCGNYPLAFTWGTDDFVAIKAAYAAAQAGAGLRQSPAYDHTSTTLPYGLYFPGGHGFLFSGLIFNDEYASLRPSVSVIGDGSDKTVLYPDGPAFVIANPYGAIVRSIGNSGAALYQGFTVDGSGYNWAHRGVNNQMDFINCNGLMLRDIQVREYKGLYAGIHGTGACDMENVSSVMNGNHAIVLEWGPHRLKNVGGSNAVSGSQENVLISGVENGLHWTGSLNDEGQKPSARIHNSKNVWIDGVLMYGGEALSVTGNSSVRISNCAIEPFGLGHATGLKIEAGSIVRAQNCSFKGRGTGFAAIQNEGILEDLGGNEIEVFDGAVPFGGSGVYRTAQQLQ